jgi:lipopolysaccharide biosynthesis regulator YciM
VHLILGNLYREKGQVGKAITVHQSLLQRPRLSRLEHAYVLLCLGLDYKRGGFVDRALEAFNEVLRLDPKNEYALVNLQKLHEEQHQWSEAYDTRQRLTKLAAIDSRPQNEAILAFLENEIGLEAMRRRDYLEASRRFKGAIALDARAVPAYLNLGDVRLLQGDEREAVAIWETLIDVAPDRAYLAFDRLEALAVRTGSPDRFTRLCRRLIDDNPQDWRARLALSRHLAASGRPREALDLQFAALVQNPHALGIHQAIWRALGQLSHEPALVDRYSELTRHAVFYLDPHVCMRCRYRSTELLWQCPHCHDWNTFVEERIAPAQDVAEVEA